jgi:hypothetical protein
MSDAKMLDVYYNFVQLGVWWSLWSIADTYLLRFTPSSEIFVFSVCVSLYVLPDVVKIARRRLNFGREKLNDALERI